MQEKKNQIQPVQADLRLPILANLRGDGQVVKRVILHQSFSIPNGTTESSLYEHKGYFMLLTSEGLICEYKDQRFVVPLANVVAAFTDMVLKK